jgi:hypothetical protein
MLSRRKMSYASSRFSRLGDSRQTPNNVLPTSMSLGQNASSEKQLKSLRLRRRTLCGFAIPLLNTQKAAGVYRAIILFVVVASIHILVRGRIYAEVDELRSHLTLVRELRKALDISLKLQFQSRQYHALPAGPTQQLDSSLVADFGGLVISMSNETDGRQHALDELKANQNTERDKTDMQVNLTMIVCSPWTSALSNRFVSFNIMFNQ